MCACWLLPARCPPAARPVACCSGKLTGQKAVARLPGSCPQGGAPPAGAMLQTLLEVGGPMRRWCSWMMQQPVKS